MRLNRFRRQFFEKIPLVIFTLVVVSFFGLGVFYFSSEIVSKFSYVDNPLAKSPPKKGIGIEILLNRNHIPFDKVSIASDSSYVVFLKDQGEVDFDSDKNLNSQISSLQLILGRLTIEGKKFKKLDLRFNEPVIEF